jgi:predicted phosphodiesterase
VTVRVGVISDTHGLPRAEGEGVRWEPGPGFAVVVAGHSHRPAIERRGGVLHVNPGSAGPRRFRLPVAVARLRVSGGEVEAELVTLDVDRPQRSA